LLPFHLKRVFSKAGLEPVHCAAASYTWNRLPLWVSRPGTFPLPGMVHGSHGAQTSLGPLPCDKIPLTL
jgi:hypothetical protein